jgi:hypothetical protein
MPAGVYLRESGSGDDPMGDLLEVSMREQGMQKSIAQEYRRRRISAVLDANT